MRKNNLLKIIVLVVFIGAIAFGIYWAINNTSKVKESINGTNLYTYEDIENSYSDGYNTALENKSEYDELLATYRDTITTLKNNINTLNSQITNLQSTITSKNSEIAQKANQLQLKTSELQTTIQNYETQISTINTTHTAELANLNTQIQSLQTQITNLQNEIASMYDYEYSLDITYIVDGENYAYGKARNGGTILVEPTEPTKTGYIFKGWSLSQNGETVTLSETTITTNTTFYAVFDEDTTIISFTIDSENYNAEENMTWLEWLESDYNTDNKWTTYEYCSITYIVLSNNVYSAISSVSVSDTIQNNQSYSVMGMAYCFVAGTKILTSLNGTTENIENLNVGDDIVSLNVFTNEKYVAKIKDVIITENVSNIVKITLANGIVVEMTEGHPLLCKNAFKSLTETNEDLKLKIGDEVYTLNGYSEIILIEYEKITTTVYNFNVTDIDEIDDVDTYDNFFANGICVHNTVPSRSDEIEPQGYQGQEL